MITWCMSHPWLTILALFMILLCIDSVVKQIVWAIRIHTVLNAKSVNSSNVEDLIRDPNKRSKKTEENKTDEC